MNNNENMRFELEEKKTESTEDTGYFSCSELYEQFIDNQSDYEGNEHTDDINHAIDKGLAYQLDYQTNYKLSELVLIAEYYDIPIKIDGVIDETGKKSRKKNKKKDELIEDIVEYELLDDNRYIVEHRKRLWFYIDEIKNDNKLSKYLII